MIMSVVFLYMGNVPFEILLSKKKSRQDKNLSFLSESGIFCVIQWLIRTKTKQNKTKGIANHPYYFTGLKKVSLCTGLRFISVIKNFSS